MKLYLSNKDSDILHLADHHPYPLLVTKSNWIIMLDTTRYVQLSQNCPYIPKIRAILPENHYGETIYLLTEDKIYTVSLELNKKQCTIKREYSLRVQASKIRKTSFYENTLFFDRTVYNMTSRQHQKRIDCNGNSYIDFISRRHSSEKEYCLAVCCEE